MKTKKLTPRQKTLLLDTQFQQEGKEKYKLCLLCNEPVNCMHHFIHKSQSRKLRFEIKNAVPVCKKCHLRIHARNNPIDIWKMTEKMQEIWGQDWKEFILQNLNNK